MGEGATFCVACSVLWLSISCQLVLCAGAGVVRGARRHPQRVHRATGHPTDPHCERSDRRLAGASRGECDRGAQGVRARAGEGRKRGINRRSANKGSRTRAWRHLPLLRSVYLLLGLLLDHY